MLYMGAKFYCLKAFADGN